MSGTGETRWLTLEGRRVHYRVEGSDARQAPQVVLVHGVGADLESWDEVVELLAPGYRLLRYDMLGHGASDKPPGPYTMRDYLAELAALLGQEGIAHAHLVGFSFGAMIGQAFALHHPARLDRLVLLSAVAGRTDTERARLAARADDLDRGGAMTTVEAAVERWFTPAFRAAHPELVDKRVRKVLANDPLGYAAAYRVFAMSEFADRLEYIAAPTLIVTGEHDPGSSVRMARLMRDRIPDSLIRVLPDLRHSLLVEAPGLVATLVDDFLAGRLRSEDWDGCGVRPPGEHAPRFTDDADLREGPA